MDGGDFGYKRRSGSVKASVNMYGGSPSMETPHMDIPEASSRARELHMTRRDISRNKERRRDAESVKAQAETELSIARKTVKGLASRIEETDYRAKSRIRDFEMLENYSVSKENVLAGRSLESRQYVEVIRELEGMKRELSKLKLDIASVLEEKLQAEKQIEASSLKVHSNWSSIEALRKDVEEVNEEQVLVELARIEALKEYGEIEADREKQANEFSLSIDHAKKKMKDHYQEIDHCKELENKLAVTLYDVNLLRNELKNFKDIEKGVQGNESLNATQSTNQRGEESEGLTFLLTLTEEIEAAKKELSSIKDEGCQFMGSMDVIRNELEHVREEIAQLKIAEEKLDLTVKNLNSKLLRANAKLEAVSAAEERANGISSNLALTLEQLKREVEAAKEEKELVTEETGGMKEEIQRTETEIGSTEEKVQCAMQDLNAVRSSEALAFHNLESVVEKTVQARESASQKCSLITISKFEYEYLTGRAVVAEELADKKVAAAQAWIKALKANEKEILVKIDMAHKEIRDTTLEEEKEVFKIERAHSTKRRVEGDLRNWKQKSEFVAEVENFQPGLVRKPRRGSVNLTPSRPAKSQRSASPGTGMTWTTSFAIKKKTKVMPKFTKLLGVQRKD